MSGIILCIQHEQNRGKNVFYPAHLHSNEGREKIKDGSKLHR